MASRSSGFSVNQTLPSWRLSQTAWRCSANLRSFPCFDVFILGYTESSHVIPLSFTGPRATSAPVICQPQFTRKGVSAIHANPIVPGPVFIPHAVASTLQLQLEVDMAPNVLLHPPRRIPVHVIHHLVIFCHSRMCLLVHILQTALGVNGQEQSTQRPQAK